MGDYQKLQVWERAHLLALEVYRITSSFPKAELYGLTSQLRRSASSVPANIAEGCGRSSDAELARFLQIALGSSSELDYHLLLAHDLGLVDAADYERLEREAQGVSKMLATFVHRLRRPETGKPTVQPVADSPQPIADSQQPIADSR